MERFSSGRNGLLGCSSFQDSSASTSSSPGVPLKTSDIDFDDVFGGPPRRSAIHHRQPSSSETGDLCRSRGEEESRLNHDKPVFGCEGLNYRRRYPSNDFFDDIFRGGESSRIRSLSSSRVLSPVLPLTPRAEPLLSSSIPPQFSLPAKVANGMDSPPLGCVNLSQYKGEDSASNVTGYTFSSSCPMSRSSCQPIHYSEESRNEVGPFSPHSHSWGNLPPVGGEELSRLDKPDKTIAEGNLSRDSGCSEVSVNSFQFHFSIFKWASKGVPLVRPLERRRHSTSKEKGNSETWSSCNGEAESYRSVSNLSIESHPVEFETQGSDSYSKENINARTEDVLEPYQIEEAFLSILKSETIKTFRNTTRDEDKKEAPSLSLPDVNLSVKSDKEVCKSESKSLHSLLRENNGELGDDGIATKSRRKESLAKTVAKPPVNIEGEEGVKNLDTDEIISNPEVDKASMLGSLTNFKDNLRSEGLKGKVRTCVEIFNQQVSSKPKTDVDLQSQSSRWKSRQMCGAVKQKSFGFGGMHEEKHSPSMNKKKVLPDAPVVVFYFK